MMRHKAHIPSVTPLAYMRCDEGEEKNCPENGELGFYSAMPVIDTDDFDALGFFHEEVGRITTSDAANCRWFVSSFGRFLGGRRIVFSDITVELVDSYRSYLVNEGFKSTTISRYCERFRSLYNKAVKRGLAPKSDAFAGIGSRRERSVPKTLSGGGSPLDAVRRVASCDFGGQPLFGQTRDLFLFSLYACGMSFADMARLKKSYVKGGRLLLPSGGSLPLLPGMVRIMGRYDAWDGEYLLPVLRSGSPEPDMVRRGRSYLHNVEGVFRMAGMSCVADADFSLRLWIDIAMELKVPAEVVSAAVPRVPDGSPLGHMNTSGATDYCTVDGALARVAESVVDCAEHWHVMRLKPGISCECVASLLERESGIGADAVYCPCEEIVRRVGGKLTVEIRSVIRNVMFFRVSDDKLPTVAKSLENAAWIYRNGRSADAEYAVVPEYELYKFRVVVSKLTDDMEFMPAERSEWSKGRSVRITGGSLNGYEGKILNMDAGAKGCRREILVRITTDTGIKVVAEVPDIFIELLR